MSESYEMWLSEVRPLLVELELREFRANHKDAAEAIQEIIERFDSALSQELGCN